MNFPRSAAELAVRANRGGFGVGLNTATCLTKSRRHPAAGTKKTLQQGRQINIRVNNGKMYSKSRRRNFYLP
jgi:hypothetical protein